MNLASAAGRLGSLPSVATYVATTRTVVALSGAVRSELESTGVACTVCSGRGSEMRPGRVPSLTDSRTAD